MEKKLQRQLSRPEREGENGGDGFPDGRAGKKGEGGTAL